ncbi:VanZ family protein [Umezawaea sp. Da 62-37]|uniref:VanZ family protein n=1 Tax=Umezawaea sp. Da 62-37 TaxID=3075927 RepID=UPI0028F74F3B|nr:VanZ family protein [Umezawaea sp. Da 62-37]WNV82665.1 VanZ family protein [Umezawaea sp. Da 62-37]
MLSSYLENIRTGFLAFVGIGALILLPLVALHYYRFGRIEPRRAVVLYGLLAYGLVALALIFLPFPDRANLCTGDQMLSTVPFQWVTDMRANMSAYGRSGIVAMATSTAFVQQAFNAALFVPLGIVLHKAYGKGVLATVFIGLGISLIVEVVQYTGNFGIYPCPYRISDIDDLIANTSGSLLGWMIAPVAIVVPALPEAEESIARPGTVSVPRKALALVADALVFLVVSRLLFPDNAWLQVGLAVVMRIVLPAATGGWTIGSWLMRYRLRRLDGARSDPLRVAVREALGVTGLVAYAVLLSPHLTSWTGFGFDLLAVALVLLGTFAVPAFRRDQLGWHERVAGTRGVLTDRTPVRVAARAQARRTAARRP